MSDDNPELWYQNALDRIPVTDIEDSEEPEEELGNNGEPIPPEPMEREER